MLARRPRRVVVWKKPAPSCAAPLKSGLSGNAGFRGGRHKGFGQRIGVAPVRHRQRAAGAVIFVGAALLVLGLLEVGQHVVITPAGIAALAPAIVILVLAAHIQQAVDRARSAQHLAARLKHLAAVQPRLRLGLVHPVDGFFLEQLAVAERHMDPDVGVLRAGLKQQHRMLAVGAQTIGEHAAGRAGADDDIVEFGSIVVIHSFPPESHATRWYRQSSRLKRLPNLPTRHGSMTLSAGSTGMDFGFAEPTAIRQRQSRGGRH